ncbi:MAG: VOC family protein [Nitrospinota bacterium]
MKRLGHVALKTANRPAMLRFYRDFLGMRVVYDTGLSAMVRLTDSEFDCGIVLADASASERAELVHRGRMWHLGFGVADRAQVDAWAERGKKEGVHVLGPVEDAYVGYFCMLRDPDGNLVELSAPEGVNGM